MFKTTHALSALLFISQLLAAECPRSADVGNYVNFFHLFKEDDDALLSFFNAKTEVLLVYQHVSSSGGLTRHRLAFRVIDKNFPPKTHLYLLLVRFNPSGLIEQIDRAARFRSTETATQKDVDAINSFFDVNINLGQLPNYQEPCYNDIIKLEYDYFYYMYAHYYKDGRGLEAPLVGP